MADIFREVDEELRAERAQALARRYGAVAIAAVVVILAAVGVWQYLQYRFAQQAQAASSRYFVAMKQADSAALPGGMGTEPKAGAAAAAAFAQVAADAPDGVATLARFRVAQLDADLGRQAEALSQWDSIAHDGEADDALRQLATLLWVQHQVDTGEPGLLKSRLAPLAKPGAPWRALAQEADAMIDLRLGQVKTARATLTRLSDDGNAPQGVRGRAAGLVQSLGPASAGG